MSGRDPRWTQPTLIDDVEAIRTELAGRGLDTTEVDRQPWGWFSFFSDPDGRRWAMQQIPKQE